jgi:hypothetical protein
VRFSFCSIAAFPFKGPNMPDIDFIRGEIERSHTTKTARLTPARGHGERYDGFA